MFTFKPKKVFEKINKMDRKQAYTIGAIAVVSVVALLMLISAMTSGEDDSFEGMKTRGYDLANMPFATDEAEQFLLANAYPDMKENGSTLLYSAAEKEARQEADEQAAADVEDMEEDLAADSSADDDGYAPSDRGGYGGYGGGAGRGGRGRGKTEIGQLSAAGMASAGGSGVNATWGPTGDFRQYKGSEDRGNETPARLNTGNARNALAQFRSDSFAAARIQQNKMANAGKAVHGGNVAGSDAFGKDGVDLSRLPNGGLTLDTSAPPTTTDLDNLDKKVAEAAKKAEEQKKEEKREWWEDMLIDLAKQAASSLVGAVMDGVGDSIKGAINGNSASRAARKQYGAQVAGSTWDKLSPEDKNYLTSVYKDNAANTWKDMKPKDRAKLMSRSTTAVQRGSEAKVEQIGKAKGTTHTSEYIRNAAQNNNGLNNRSNTGNDSNANSN